MQDSLNLLITPGEFFQEKISKALFRQKVYVSSEVEFYLVNLLCEFIEPTQIETAQGRIDLLDTPLALLLKSALEAPRSDQLKIYRKLGDTSLYISGYFQDYFNNKAFDANYFIQLGASAYINVSQLTRESSTLSSIYEDLAGKFGSLVEVVAEVSDQLSGAKDANLLALYDRWTRNNSERLRRKLQEHGIDPIQTNPKIRQ